MIFYESNVSLSLIVKVNHFITSMFFAEYDSELTIKNKPFPPSVLKKNNFGQKLIINLNFQ
jgi:hypothetical protein